MKKLLQQQKNIIVAICRDIKPKLTKQWGKHPAELAWPISGQTVTLLLSIVSIKSGSIGTKRTVCV
ncbi:MAG: hypothetical protein WAV76_00205 [Bacteroidota bacterium]